MDWISSLILTLNFNLSFIPLTALLCLCISASLINSLLLDQKKYSLLKIFGHFIGNIFALFFGIPIFAIYSIYTIILLISVRYSRFGIALFRCAISVIFPFGRDRIEIDDSIVQSLGNEHFHFIWLFLGCAPLAIVHLAVALAFAISGFGIPNAIEHWKLAKDSIWPFDKIVVH